MAERFNLGITNMNVCQVPKQGILVSKYIIDRVVGYNGNMINNSDEEFKGIKMVYAPAALIKIKK